MTLSERVRFRLRMLWLGLTMKPIAGGAPEGDGGEGEGDGGEPSGDGKGGKSESGKGGQEPPKKKGEEKPKKGDDGKPPWGDDENYDAERAASLIKNLRADNDELKQKVDKFETDKLSEKERLEKRAERAEGEAKEAGAELLKLRVGLRKGLTETQAKRLVGETEEELEADADELLESFGAKDDGEGKGTRRRPQERLKPGASPSSKPEETDPRKLAADLPRHA